jgi:hypothetical protein
VQQLTLAIEHDPRPKTSLSLSSSSSSCRAFAFSVIIVKRFSRFVLFSSASTKKSDRERAEESARANHFGQSSAQIDFSLFIILFLFFFLFFFFFMGFLPLLLTRQFPLL